MPIFDYKGHDARAEVSEAFKLAQYSQIKAFGFLADTISTTFVEGGVYLPGGWQELTASQLGLSSDHVDATGFYTGATSSSAQAKVLGHVAADGHIDRVSISFAGTNDLGDVVDYAELSHGQYIEQFRYLLDATATFSANHDLQGSDVVVTGYSLGGGATNIMAEKSDELSGGFYSNANYFGFSSPTIYDNSDKILNFGAENDVVYRVIGDDNKSVAEGLVAALHNDDHAYGSSADNVVLFNDLYASPLSPYAPFGVLNVVGGWNAHITGLFSPAAEVIAESTFYDLIEKDSTVVVSQLSDLTRGIVWVEDAARATSSHHGTPAFLLGSQHDDLLRDGAASDFLDGFAGNDRFSLSSGNDLVSGGEGIDVAELDGPASDYDAIRLQDGTLVLDGTAAGHGLKELTSVESLTFKAGLLSASYVVGESGLHATRWFQADLGYATHREGSETGDTLGGTVGADRLFGLGGDDTLSGGAGSDLLHGGAGNDTLVGGTGNDRLFGGSGNDHLVGGAGDDRLSGGVGHDVFDFASDFGGRDVITDFDAFSGDHDTLLLSASLFQTTADVLSGLHQVGDDVLLGWKGGSLVLSHTHVADITADAILLA